MPVNLESNAESGATPVHASALDHATKTVLIIDDSDDIRMVISESLNIYGFQTITAEDGGKGIELARQRIPDLIICDVNMPGIDGYATLTAIRENEATATIPFIFLSGEADKINMRRGMELGADDYLIELRVVVGDQWSRISGLHIQIVYDSI